MSKSKKKKRKLPESSEFKKSTESLNEVGQQEPLQNIEPNEAYADSGPPASPRSWFTDVVVIGIASVLAYVCAYKYEFGYMVHFGAATHFVQVDIPELLDFSNIVLLMLFFALMVVFYSAWQFDVDHHPYQFVAIVSIPFATILLTALSVQGWDEYLIHALCGFGLAILAIFWIVAHRVAELYKNVNPEIYTRGTVRRYIAIAQRLLYLQYSPSARAINQKSFIYVVVSKIGFVASLVLVFAVMLILVLPDIGEGLARSRSRFLIPSKFENAVVLRIYGDDAVCAAFSQERGEVYPIYFVVENKYENTGGLRSVETGKLTLADSIPPEILKTYKTVKGARGGGGGVPNASPAP